MTPSRLRTAIVVGIEARQALHEAVNLPRGLELIESAQRGDDSLSNRRAITVRLYNLEILVWVIPGSAFLGSKEHGCIIGDSHRPCQ